MREGGESEAVVEVLAGTAQDDCVKTFILRNEDHTLANALRWIILKDTDVQFCGYTIPHPSQREVHLRIQTYKKPALEALRRGLERLAEVTDTIIDRVNAAAEEFRQQPTIKTSPA